nr:hypothetical protein [uncultured Kingella sp.]
MLPYKKRRCAYRFICVPTNHNPSYRLPLFPKSTLSDRQKGSLKPYPVFRLPKTAICGRYISGCPTAVSPFQAA